MQTRWKSCPGSTPSTGSTSGKVFNTIRDKCLHLDHLQRWKSLFLRSGTVRQLFQSTWRQSTIQKTSTSSRKLNWTSVSFSRFQNFRKRMRMVLRQSSSGKPSKGGEEAGYKDWMFMNYTFKRWIPQLFANSKLPLKRLLLQFRGRGTQLMLFFRFEGESLRTTRPSVAYAEVKVSPEGGKLTTTTTLPTAEPYKPSFDPTPTNISRKGGEWLWKNRPTNIIIFMCEGNFFAKLRPKLWLKLDIRFYHRGGNKVKKAEEKSVITHCKVSFTQNWEVATKVKMSSIQRHEDANVIVQW